MAHPHHHNLSAIHDHLNVADKGDLTNAQQAAGFVSDPLLTPITSSSMPHPISPDPTPSSDPSHFDASTRHPNTDYHPTVKLSKKKRAQKLGVGSVPPHPHGVHAGGRPFGEHDKAAHERAERRDSDLTHRAKEEQEGEGEEEGEEYEDAEDDDEEPADHQEQRSHAAHHENRITGTEMERGGAAPAKPKPNPTAGHQPAGTKQEGDKGEGEKGGEGEKQVGTDGGEQQAAPSMKERASGLLASAQEKASGVVDSVMQAPVVGSLLSKVGLGGAKAEDNASDTNAQATKEEEA